MLQPQHMMMEGFRQNFSNILDLIALPLLAVIAVPQILTIVVGLQTRELAVSTTEPVFGPSLQSAQQSSQSTRILFLLPVELDWLSQAKIFMLLCRPLRTIFDAKLEPIQPLPPAPLPQPSLALPPRVLELDRHSLLSFNAQSAIGCLLPAVFPSTTTTVTL
jgi:hypothetical protein